MIPFSWEFAPALSTSLDQRKVVAPSHPIPTIIIKSRFHDDQSIYDLLFPVNIEKTDKVIFDNMF